MRKVLCLVLVMLLSLPVIAVAESYDALSVEELRQKRDELIAELNLVNNALGPKARDESFIETDESLGKIKDLFPDELFAMCIRDKVGKLSIEQSVTQADLDTITYISSRGDYGKFNSLAGIGYLRNVTSLSFYYGAYMGTEFPDELYTLTKLEKIWVSDSPFDRISEDIRNLTNLTELKFYKTNLSALPESIGCLTNLKTLDVGDTNISALPESIGNLINLKTLDIANTKITALPDSIWDLSFDSLDMSGLPIK